MEDIIHTASTIDREGTAFGCVGCGMKLPVDVVTLSDCGSVNDVGGLGTMLIPRSDRETNGVVCTSKRAAHIRGLAAHVSEVQVNSDVPIQAGDSKKAAHPVDQMTKMVTNGGFQNFLALREATRPKDQE